MKKFLRILNFFMFILLVIFVFYKYKSIANSNIYRSKFMWQVLDSATPLKDLTVLAEQDIQNDKIVNYIYGNNSNQMFENINFDLNYSKKNKILSIKRIFLQGIGTKDTACWKYLEEINIPVNNELIYDNKNGKFTCIDDYKKSNALSLDLDIDNKGYLIKKELKGTTLQKEDSLGNILIKFYTDKNLLIFSNTKTKQNLFMEKQENKEIYKDKSGNVIKIYEALFSFSEKYKQNLIQKIIVKDNKNNIIKTVIFEYD